MGDVLNIAALHANGEPRATFGIRGNTFEISKPSSDENLVRVVDPKSGSLDRLEAMFQLSDGSLVEERFKTVERALNSILKRNDDTEEPALEAEDGILLVDDETESPIGDSFNEMYYITDLQNRITVLENLVLALIKLQSQSVVKISECDVRMLTSLSS